MDILNPDYGYQILTRFSKVTKYDYTDKPKKDNPLGNEGISLIIWDGKYSSKITYKKNNTHFLIEDDYYQYINIHISNDNITKAHYEYFSDAIEYLKSHEQNLKDIRSGFGARLPIGYTRQEKLNEIIQ
jgi:hypothetical protein